MRAKWFELKCMKTQNALKFVVNEPNKSFLVYNDFENLIVCFYIYLNWSLARRNAFLVLKLYAIFAFKIPEERFSNTDRPDLGELFLCIILIHV